MCKKCLFAVVLFALLLAPLAIAQDAENPTIAILRFGDAMNDDISSTENGVLDVLEAFAYISADERAALAGRNSLEGENISIVWGDAAFDFANATLAVDSRAGSRRRCARHAVDADDASRDQRHQRYGRPASHYLRRGL